MTDPDDVRCVWCHRLGHEAEDHPLPQDHQQYDAFYDATDDELAVMVSDAIAPGGRSPPRVPSTPRRHPPMPEILRRLRRRYGVCWRHRRLWRWACRRCQEVRYQ